MVVGSDFAFMQRGVASVASLSWIFYHMYHADRFNTWHWSRLRRLEIKSLVTLDLAICLVLLISYDAMCVYLKYNEGFIVIPHTQRIIAKPISLWSPEDKRVERAAMYMLTAYYAFQNLGIFLLQNFWNYLTTSIINTQFIASWHFKVNYVFGAVAFVLFPSSAYLLRNDPLKREVVPTVLAMMCNIIILAYGIRAHFRFQQLIREQDRMNANAVTVTKLRYYRNMNKLFMLCVFITAFGMLLLVSDGLLVAHPFTTHKVIFDFLFAIIIYAHALVFIIVALIFFPQKSLKFTSNDLSLSNGRRRLETTKSAYATTKTLPHNDIAVQVEMHSADGQRAKTFS